MTYGSLSGKCQSQDSMSDLMMTILENVFQDSQHSAEGISPVHSPNIFIESVLMQPSLTIGWKNSSENLN
jgi:hypothetical protein